MDVKKVISKRLEVEQQDPYLSVYAHAKMENPKTRMVWAQFRKGDISAVDYLVRISRGKREEVITTEDWMIVAKIFEFWTRRWPQEWQEFASSIKAIRSTRARKDGLSKGRGIKYVGALPQRFSQLIKIIFPLQQFDKVFVNKLVKNIQIIRVGEKNESYFVVPSGTAKRLSTTEIVEKEVTNIKCDKINKNGGKRS